MKKFIVITFSTLILATTAAFPATLTQSAPAVASQPYSNFASNKANLLRRIASRIRRLQKLQPESTQQIQNNQTLEACVRTAQDQEAIKVCREQFKQNMSKLYDDSHRPTLDRGKRLRDLGVDF
jgi:hypothetical protein